MWRPPWAQPGLMVYVLGGQLLFSFEPCSVRSSLARFSVPRVAVPTVLVGPPVAVGEAPEAPVKSNSRPTKQRRLCAIEDDSAKQLT